MNIATKARKPLREPVAMAVISTGTIAAREISFTARLFSIVALNNKNGSPRNRARNKKFGSENVPAVDTKRPVTLYSPEKRLMIAATARANPMVYIKRLQASVVVARAMMLAIRSIARRVNSMVSRLPPFQTLKGNAITAQQKNPVKASPTPVVNNVVMPPLQAVATNQISLKAS